MIRKISFLMLGLVAFFVSCSVHSSEEMKAYATLQKLKTSHFPNHTMLDSASIQESIDYFWQHSHLDLLADTYYYMGCKESDKGEIEKAIYHLKCAEKYSAKLHDSCKMAPIEKKIADLRNHALIGNAVNNQVNSICEIFDLRESYEVQIRTLYQAGLSMMVILFVLGSYFYSQNRKNSKSLKLALVHASFQRAPDEGWVSNKDMKRLALGRQLYLDIEKGETTAMWTKDNFMQYIAYYKLVDSNFLIALEKEYDSLTPQNIFYKILCHRQVSEEAILHILCKTNGALRTMKSRIKARKR